MSEQIARFHADQDAFGHEIMDFYQDPLGEHLEIIERDDGFIGASAGPAAYFSEYPDWPENQRAALEELVAGRVLDLGSGAGRIELYLQAHGFDVVGIDNSPLAVEVCRLRGARDVRLIPVEKVNNALGTFDNILMVGNNWGLMANRAQAKRLLHRFYHMTSPGARIIAESNDVYNTTNSVHLAYQAWNRERGRMSGQIRMRVRHGIYCSKWFDYLMVSRAEMEEILLGTGWRLQTCYPSPGSNYAAVLVKV